MHIHPIGHVHPAFGSWLERRRKRMEAQLSALDDERFDDLAVLIGADDEDRPPQPRSEAEREEYRRMLDDSRRLTERLAMVRSRILDELKDIERRQVRSVPVERRSGRGGALDGYL